MSKFSLLQREQSSGCPEGDQTKDGHGGPHTAPTQMRRGLADGGLGQPRHRQGDSSVPVLCCAQFCFDLFCPLSFQKWHEAIQSQGQHLSFVCSPLTIYFLFHLVAAALQAVTPTMLLQVSAHSGLICSGKNSRWIKCPCGNST